MSREERQRIQKQFGDKAAAYAASAVHAHGGSLRRLVELTSPQDHWRVLDVATGAGHTAHAFARHARQVVASDLTLPMVQQARQLSKQLGLKNLSYATADGERLPLEDDCIDLLTCRLAAHHFSDVAAFVREAARVVRGGGLVAISDNVVPGSKRRGKEARLLNEIGHYVNAFEKLRDPSHKRHLTMYQWRDHFVANRFALLHEEADKKAIDFADYVARSGVAPPDVVRLRAMLVQAPQGVLEFLTPIFQGDTITFHLTEAIFIGRLE
jgi:ubiquinone/menaquinone biosynthesis C-methylase UbiE